MVFLIVAATVPLLKWARQNGVKVVRKLAVASHAIVLIQVGLGILTVATYIRPHGVTSHLFFAALLWADLFVLNVLVRRTRAVR